MNDRSQNLIVRLRFAATVAVGRESNRSLMIQTSNWMETAIAREADLKDKLAKAEAAISGMEQMLAGQRIELAQARADSRHEGDLL